MPTATQVYIVDDDDAFRNSLEEVLDTSGFVVKSFSSARAFLADESNKAGCLVADVRMPDMDGVQLLEEVRRRGIEVLAIMIAGAGDVSVAVKAIKAGAIDFIEKPFDHETLVASIREAINTFHTRHEAFIESNVAREMLDSLTRRERTVLEKLVSGESNKVAAFELGISPRTIEIHRSNIMHKLNVRNIAGLVRVFLAAERSEDNQ